MALKTIKPDGTGDYTTIQAWEDWADDQLSADQDAECYRGGDLGEFTIRQWTTAPDAANYPHIYTTIAERHKGKDNECGAYVDAASACIVGLPFTRVEGLRFQCTSTGRLVTQNYGGADTPSNVVFDSNLLIQYGNQAAILVDSPVSCIVRNNIIVLDDSTNNATGIDFRSVNGFIHNNTVHARDAGQNGISVGVGGGNQCEALNNIVTYAAGQAYTDTGCYELRSGTFSDFDHNLSTDGTADDWGVDNNLINKTSANQYVNESYDWYLVVTADAYTAGQTIAAFDWDALHLDAANWRPKNGTWDMGALERDMGALEKAVERVWGAGSGPRRYKRRARYAGRG
jgi:hypothetical protein